MKKYSSFEVLYATMRYIHEERKTVKGNIPDHDFPFEELEIFISDPKFCEKMASVLNYITAQVLMKMNLKTYEIREVLSSIIEEQMFLIESTVHDFPDGPLRKRSYQK